MLLPTEKTPPKVDLTSATIFLYGPHKFGKSEWCAKAEDALFLATEPGLNHLTTYQVEVPTWEKFLAACAELAEGKHSFKTVIVDTIDNAQRLCVEYVCRQQKIIHESDLGFAKGYALVASEFQRVMTKLTFLGLGVIFVSHSQEKEVDSRVGKFIKQVPSLPDKPRKYLTGLCDFILFADFEPAVGPNGERLDRRVLRTKPSKLYEAGDRTGRLPETLEFDYPTFVEAFRVATARSAKDTPTQSSTKPASISPPPATDSSSTSRANPSAAKGIAGTNQ